MKKAITFILSLLMLSLNTVTFAKEDQLKGFDEKYENLFMRNYFSKEQLTEINQLQLDDFNNRIWAHWLEEIREEPGAKITQNEETEYAWFYKMYVEGADSSNGAKVNYILSNKYMFQYADAGNIDYLLSDKNYWMVQNYNFARYYYDENGIFKDEITEIFDDSHASKFLISKMSRQIFDDPTLIEEALINKGETEVTNMKFFCMPYPAWISFLYIETPQNEYLVKVGVSSDYDVIANLEFGTLYTVDEMMDALADTELATRYTIKYSMIELEEVRKSTYDAEAESLQQQGLLQGNENGLDLLKPLTRAEAVTLLIRAMGLEDQTSNYTVSQFADIASDNWASPYAALAKEEGITNGISDTEFAPDDLVTADQFATFALRAAGESNFDYTQGIQILIDQGIITEEESETMDLFTRGDMAKIIYEARENGLL